MELKEVPDRFVSIDGNPLRPAGKSVATCMSSGMASGGIGCILGKAIDKATGNSN